MKLSSYRDMIERIASYQDIIDLTKLRKRLNEAKDSSKQTIVRINLLIDALALANSYLERLTQIKISFRKVEAQLQKTLMDKRTEVMLEDEFTDSKRKSDQQFLIERKCRHILEVKDGLTAKQESVQYAIDYVTSAAFNIKSIMSSLREYFNAEGVK